MITWRWSGVHAPSAPGTYEVYGHWRVVDDDLTFVVTNWVPAEL